MKKSETNIEKLKNHRRLNTKEKNVLVRDEIFRKAKFWRELGIPELLKKVFQERNLNIDDSIIIELELDVLGGSSYEGIILVSNRRFYEFDIDLSTTETDLFKVYSFEDITDRFVVSHHVKGIEKTFGFIAMEVLEELRGKL